MKYTANVFWQKGANEPFVDNKYSRSHKWLFDGGTEVAASSSPQVVPVPLSNEAAVDPEEALVAALSSCHMLFFLALAASKGYTVETYEDQAEGLLGKNENGKMAMTAVTLKPKVIFSGPLIPTHEQITALHELAHEKCYIANSVTTEVAVIPA